MNARHKTHVKWALLLLCILAFTLFLVACGNGESTTSTGPTPTPTPSGTTSTGNGYTVTYPQGWTVNKQTLGPLETTTFTSNNNPTTTLSIAVTSANPLTNFDQIFTTAQNALKNNASFQQDTTNLPPASIGGDTWQETGGTYNQNGTQIKGVVLGDQHPANTGNVFVITLTAKADSYNQDYSTGFQPILQSFKFTS